MSGTLPKKEESEQSLMDDLRQLLLDGNVTKQEEICAELQAKGHHVNQSKVSRLIHKLNAIKSKNELGQIVYRLAREPAPPTTSSQLSSLIIEVIANETIIIVNTSPGAAQLVARVLDYHKDKIEILGTIAGDDSIFIAPKSVKTIQYTYSEIKKLLFN
ncbi:Arginine repressor [Legionella beliardensis]|uniref:Arginine repressor n=1 Tax=Legionella beliardensis TaxID=91822 RepID=A0A378I122_9GAMM|nr:ArgR family transcriptional regulator [Legionella beliardensis]STX28849.1 Arginine repressor [Legionella beliardensis]